MFRSVAAGLSDLNGWGARRHTIEDDAHCEHVGARVELFAVHLLGRHVRELALDLADRRGRRHLSRCLCDAEVDELDDSCIGNQEVLR